MAHGNFIWTPPLSRGKVKSEVDVFASGDICHASLLHLTKDFSGRPEKARRGAMVHSTNLRLFSIERSVFSEKASHFCYSIYGISSLCRAIQPHIIPYAQKSNRGPSMNDLEVYAFVLDPYWLPRVLAFQAGWSGVDVCWDMAAPFLFVAYGALAFHCCKIHLPVFLSLFASLCRFIFLKCFIHNP